METLRVYIDILASVTPSEWCRAFYLTASAGILSMQLLPRDASRALMDYGARSQVGGTGEKAKDKAVTGDALPPVSQQESPVDWLMSFIEVPHSWFWHFYALSLSCSVFWALQFVQEGPVLRFLVGRQARVDGGQFALDMGCVTAAWAMMAVQGSRRLYESLCVTKSGSSPMSIPHWGMGLIFYASMGISVWIEGSDTILTSWKTTSQDTFRTVECSTLRLPSTVAGIMLFTFASWKQNQCHRHLAGLRKYTLPVDGWFQYFVCPHYTCECLIYLAISIVAAPQGQLCNKTVLCGALFVAVNLGVTAHRTKQWYGEKFGKEKVAGRNKMVPFVF